MELISYVSLQRWKELVPKLKKWIVLKVKAVYSPTINCSPKIKFVFYHIYYINV